MLTELPDDIYTLMSSPERWSLSDETVTICSPYKGSFPVVFEGPLSDFSKYHPLFPQRLKALLTWTKSRGMREHTYGDEVAPTLDYLVSGGVVFTRDKEYVFSKVAALQIVGKRDLIWVSGTEVDIREIQVDDLAVPVVISSSERQYMISKDQFNGRYPGWENRWHTGQSLGLETKELMLYVFATGPEPVACIEEIDFD